MACERFTLETLDGAIELPRTDLVSLEVELDHELAGMFRLRLAIRRQRDGRWTYVDEERFRPWMPMRITGGLDGDSEELLSGYITHVRTDFPSSPAHCALEIWGMDESVLMDREEKLRAWPSYKDSVIAEEIFAAHGFDSVVDDTEIVHDQAISTIIQRESDMRFLKRLALRNGYECYVDGKTGFFRAPRLAGTPQRALAVHFGPEGNVNRFSVEVNALAPTRVTMFQVGRGNKKILEETATGGRQKALGAMRPSDFLRPGIPPGQMYVGMNAATGMPEMAALCHELLQQSEWFVAAEGEIDGKRYGGVLKPHATVTIKGVGATYSGVYYVTHVTHGFTPNGYTQFFRARRNALMPTGAEDFGAAAARPNPY